MKKEKFEWGKFILDCIICFCLMVFSIIVFFIPIGYIIEYLLDVFLIKIMEKNTTSIILGGWGNFALYASISSIIIPSILILFLKNAEVKYKIHKLSFWVVFLIITAYLFSVAYELGTTNKIK